MLQKIANIIQTKEKELEAWYQNKLANRSYCFYSSIDLRYSGNKLVPVDTNLFPAGFNNLSLANINQAIKFSKNYLESNFSKATKILLIGEDHTRNLHYLDNLKTLANILTEAGYQCKIGSLTVLDTLEYQGIIHSNIMVFPLTKRNSLLETMDGFSPDLILLNNDLMTGWPDKLQNLNQPIIPHPNNGWFKRRKSHHFTIYNQLLAELEDLFGLPSFLLTTDFSVCNGVNFKDKQGIDVLAKKVEMLLKTIKEKYNKYNIDDDPYVVIKSDYGTYGMGVVMVKSGDDVYSLNKKHRKQMHITKNNIINDQVIIQEGVKTIDRINGDIAEPLLYLIDHKQVGFLYRTHTEKDEYSNLNSVGMKISNYNSDFNEYHQCCNFIARLATLAAALEI